MPMRLPALLMGLTLASAVPLGAQPSGSPPATQAVAPVPAVPTAPLATLLPLQITGQDIPAWITRSVQQSVGTEIAFAGYAMAARPPAAGATLPLQTDPGIVVGVTCDRTGPTLSIRLSVLDLAGRAASRQISVQGSFRDLLSLKDQVRSQLRQLLDQRREAMQASAQPQAPAPGPAPAPAAPIAAGGPAADPPGWRFQNSALLRSMENPDRFAMQYRPLYDAKPFRGGYDYGPYWTYPYYGYGGGWGPLALVGCSSQQWQDFGLGVGLSFGYGGNIGGGGHITVHGGDGGH
jgi:hypothetical protein